MIYVSVVQIYVFGMYIPIMIFWCLLQEIQTYIYIYSIYIYVYIYVYIYI